MGEMSGEELVEAIEAASGRHPGKRRAHATGIVATGTFTATPAAAGLCTAAAVLAGAVPATVRFSNGTGNPATRDDDQNGRGIAMKLWADGDPAWDLVGLSLPQFFEQLDAAVTFSTFLVGLIKAPVFAVLIGMVACYEGLKVSGSAESVGIHTTRSVVKSIFLVILFDAAFSIFFSQIGL